MNIAVCVKIVPDPVKAGDVKFDPVTQNVIRDNLENVVNPTDLHAIEAAVQLKEANGGKISLFTMGPPAISKQIREALSYSVDDAFLLSDRAFGGADSLATAYTLAQGISNKGPFDIIVCGNESSDGGTTHVPTQIGEWLELPHIMEVTSIRYDGEQSVIARRKMDGGEAEYRIGLPCVLAVSKSINKVRYPGVKGILASKKKPIVTLTHEDIDGFDTKCSGQSGSPTRNGAKLEVSFAREAEDYGTDPKSIAEAIMNRIYQISD